MALIIGLDTGGTFTDAAILDSESRMILATAKALTTRHDLSVGVGHAVCSALTAWGGDRAAVSLVSLSTTLATNAVVESVGGTACLVLIGFDNESLGRAGLSDALGSEPCIFVAGGHGPDGRPQCTFDSTALLQAVAGMKHQVSSFAIAGYFATRNPEHELAAREIITRASGLPVTCSHELSSSLGGPRRALTTLLNARLISLLDRLISATRAEMGKQGLNCPLMVVKGDGSLLQADFARSRPVETILSGPAASLSGAAFLADTRHAVIADIGGTTTDIARLQGGAPMLSRDGANVGGWRTMVEAAHIRTSGLGGDSEIRPDSRALEARLQLGPRRAVPLSLLCCDHPDITDLMTLQLNQPIAQPTDGRFVIPVMPDGVPDWLSRSEMRLAQTVLDAGMMALCDLATTQVALGAVDRLVRRGLLMLSAFTPTDASHVLGHFNRFDSQAALCGARLLARQKSANGNEIADSPEAVSQMALDELTLKSAIAILDTAFAEQGAAEHTISSSVFLVNSLKQRQQQLSTEIKNPDSKAAKMGPIASTTLSLDMPLVALGASAAAYYPDIARLLGAELIIPPFSEVAGAVGAAAGSVRQRVMILVTQPSEGVFRIHLPAGPIDLPDLKAALKQAELHATNLAAERARAAGASIVTVSMDRQINEVSLGPDKTVFLQAAITADATGTPA